MTEKSDSRGKLFEARYNSDRTIDRLGGIRYYYILTTDENCREYRANCTGKKEQFFTEKGRRARQCTDTVRL